MELKWKIHNRKLTGKFPNICEQNKQQQQQKHF